MQRWCITLALLLLGCACAESPAAAQAPLGTVASSGGESGPTAWIGGSAARTRVLVGSDGQTYVGVWIDAPDHAPSVQERAPMDVALVVDTSGSMSGEKITNARMAASSFLETLRDGDIVSLYAFSDGVSELAPPTRVGPETRPSLMRAVQELQAAGGTNMYDGIRVGIGRLEQAPSTHTVRRVVLISDGHANIGPSDPSTLGQLAANGTEYGVQVTAIGVGLDYDETMLSSLAVHSSGRMYHLSDPSQMATILDQELHLLQSTVATNATIEIDPAPGVTILDAETPGATVQNNRLHMPVGSIYAGQRREVLFRARIDTSRTGNRPLAQARLSYRASGGAHRSEVQHTALHYDVTRDAQAVHRSAAPRVAAMVATTQAAQAQLRAAAALNRGDRTTATAELAEAEHTLARAAAAAPTAPAVRRRLEQQAQSVAHSRAAASGAGAPSAARGVALHVYSDAYSSQGY